LGQEAEREKLHGINSEINLEGLPKGIYFWQIWEKRILLGQGKLVKDK
jgi:hypothetical protein